MQRKRNRPPSVAKLAHLRRLNLRRSEATRPAVGSLFGTLTVTGYVIKKGKLRATVRCACGVEKAVMIQHIRRSKSCGCLTNSIIAKARTRHGMTDSPAWLTWKNMLDRCRNKNCASWSSYGGRGIQVCERWETFENFFADMGARIGELTIERIDNDGNYEPSNCRWATSKEQAINRRSTVFLEAFGKKQSVTDWAAEIGIQQATLNHRIRANWPTEKALTQPLRPMIKFSEWKRAK